MLILFTKKVNNIHVYVLQKSSKVEALPLVFATFSKGKERRMFGFLLYGEAQEMRAIDKRWKEGVTTGREKRGVWFPVIQSILAALGGSADLE